MSFKRDRDDHNQLEVLRQRRIRDLFSEDIPDDEASLLSNGRLTCLVCNHRPIFDTMNMLAIHRRGKKHEANIRYQKIKKLELKVMIQKRQHEKFLQDGTTDIDQAVTSYRGLGDVAPYDPRTKKKIKPYDRKLKVDLLSTAHVQRRTAICTSTTASTKLPGNRPGPPPQINQYKYQSTTVTMDGNHGEGSTESVGKMNVGRMDINEKAPEKQKEQKKCEKIDNFSSKRKKILEDLIKLQDGGPVKHPNSLRKLVDRSRNRSNLEAVPYTSKKNRTASDISDNNLSVRNKDLSDLPHKNDDSDKFHNPNKETVMFELKRGDLQAQRSKSKWFNANSLEKTSGSQGDLLRGTDIVQSSTSVTSNKDTMTRAEKALMLRGAGWKRDWDGKWIRDEDAEFDSDEETPDLL